MSAIDPRLLAIARNDVDRAIVRAWHRRPAPTVTALAAELGRRRQAIQQRATRLRASATAAGLADLLPPAPASGRPAKPPRDLAGTVRGERRTGITLPAGVLDRADAYARRRRLTRAALLSLCAAEGLAARLAAERASKGGTP